MSDTQELATGIVRPTGVAQRFEADRCAWELPETPTVPLLADFSNRHVIGSAELSRAENGGILCSATVRLESHAGAVALATRPHLAIGARVLAFENHVPQRAQIVNVSVVIANDDSDLPPYRVEGCVRADIAEVLRDPGLRGDGSIRTEPGFKPDGSIAEISLVFKPGRPRE